MQWSGRNEISLRNNLEDAEVADSAGQGVMQWSGRNEISPRNNIEDAEVAVKKPRLRVRQGKTGCNGRNAMRFLRFHRVIILFETVSCLKPVARRGGFGNRGPPRGVMRSDAMNCGPPRVCLGSLSKSIKHRGIPCPDVLTNPVFHEKIWIRVCFFRCRRGEPRGARTDVPRRGRRGYFARRHAAYRPGDAPAPKPPFSLTPTCRRSSPAGASG